MPEELQHKSLWVGIGKQVLSFAIGVICAAFILGRNSQKINDVVLWKNEAGPRIERMDRQGSLSFENFKQNYEKEQAKQYDRLQKLEMEVSHLDNVELRLDRLENKLKPDP